MCSVFLLLNSNILIAQKYPAMFDATIDTRNIAFERVAIIPNRLPLTLAEPEYWRKINWQYFAEEFSKKGFTVIDYNTTLEAFKKSNLPLEDTKASEEKFAAFAQTVNADLIIMPYYSSYMKTRTGCLSYSKVGYVSTSSIQAYSLDHNKFIYRSDSHGRRGYTTGVWTIVGLAITIIGPLLGAGNEVYYIGGGVTFLGTLRDFINSSISPESRWKSAFKDAIKENVAPLTAVAKPYRSKVIEEIKEGRKYYKFCTGCGAKIPYDAKFCPECGARQ